MEVDQPLLCSANTRTVEPFVYSGNLFFVENSNSSEGPLVEPEPAEPDLGPDIAAPALVLQAAPDQYSWGCGSSGTVYMLLIVRGVQHQVFVHSVFRFSHLPPCAFMCSFLGVHFSSTNSVQCAFSSYSASLTLHTYYYTPLYLSGTFITCQHGANSHFFRVFSIFFQCTKMLFTKGGGICILFEVCEKRA